MAVTINGKIYRNQQEQIYKNMDDIQELKDIIKPEYTTSATLTSSSTSVAIASTNAPAGTTEGWLMTQDGLKFKITGGDDTNLLLMFYADLKGPQGEEGPEGPGGDPTTLIDDNSVLENKTWSSDKINSELASAGKTYYQHNITMYANFSNHVNITITTTNNVQMTQNDVIAYLKDKGFTENTKSKPCTGYISSTVVCGLFVMNDTLYWNSNNSMSGTAISFTYVEDIVE